MNTTRRADRCGLHGVEAGTLFPYAWVGSPHDWPVVDFGYSAAAYVGKPVNPWAKPAEPQARKLRKWLDVRGEDYCMKPALNRFGIVYDMAASYGARRPRHGSVLAVVRSMLAAARDSGPDGESASSSRSTCRRTRRCPASPSENNHCKR